MNTKTLKYVVSALTMTALLATAGTAFAQYQQEGGGNPAAGTQAAPPPPSAPLDVDDATVSDFADAFLSVQEISADLTEKLSEAPSAEAAQTLQREAQDKMAQTVEESGISVEQYNDIAVGMRRDQELAQRVKTAVDQAR